MTAVASISVDANGPRRSIAYVAKLSAGSMRLVFKHQRYCWYDTAVRDSTVSLSRQGSLRFLRGDWQTSLREVRPSTTHPPSQHPPAPDLESGTQPACVQRHRSHRPGRPPGCHPAVDFDIGRLDRMIHVLNAPGPGATASLLIGEEIVATAELAWFSR